MRTPFAKLEYEVLPAAGDATITNVGVIVSASVYVSITILSISQAWEVLQRASAGG